MAQTRPNAPVGTLNQKTARQPRVVASRPPSSGPTTCAADTMVTLSPSPRVRSSGGNASVSRAVVLVTIDAAPTACTPRITSSSTALVAKPQARPATVNTASPTR